MGSHQFDMLYRDRKLLEMEECVELNIRFRSQRFKTAIHY
jgi:hypothetical protein